MFFSSPLAESGICFFCRDLLSLRWKQIFGQILIIWWKWIALGNDHNMKCYCFSIFHSVAMPNFCQPWWTLVVSSKTYYSLPHYLKTPKYRNISNKWSKKIVHQLVKTRWGVKSHSVNKLLYKSNCWISWTNKNNRSKA